jgi:1-acyl-sn-glycerol-3-phosphate acyltransferase
LTQRGAVYTGVPIVPVVSIGAQETQLFVSRGDRLAKRLGLHRIRLDILPVTVGLPFDIFEVFGSNPDVAEVDAYVRTVMQEALDRLARQRRFPVLG